MAKKIKEDDTSQGKMHLDEMQIITRDPGVASMRGSGEQTLKVEELAVNVNLFVQQMGKVLENTPEMLGKFHFDEFEIHAEVSADGKIAILGTGVQAGVGGGLRFLFRRGKSE